MEELKEYEGIGPYTDQEAADAIARLANHPYVYRLSRYLFPGKPVNTLRKALKKIHTVDEFQQVVMNQAVGWVLDNTTEGLTYEGIENVKGIEGKFLAMSNHRDIILDPAFTQYVLLKNGVALTEIAVGDNLISSKTVERLLRCNRSIKVIRGISARELYVTSKVLSNYIRNTIVSGKSSVWIAQRQGRTKDGADTTEQGLLKMFDMSGKKGKFAENFQELNIVPLSISYEYESCDARKAREMLISRSRKYVKKKDEDMHSIMTGIRQQKGRVHLCFGKPLTADEIASAAACTGNDRYQHLKDIVDRRIVEGYKLWKTNYIAYDMVYGTDKYSSMYTLQQKADFEQYVAHKLGKMQKSLDRTQLRDIFLRIYSNPVLSKENL
ncbi:MAG: acyltransferase [Bacteroidales bacterium]|nr:acyltransferase [Bacteroidales bacterium]